MKRIFRLILLFCGIWYTSKIWMRNLSVDAKPTKIIESFIRLTKWLRISAIFTFSNFVICSLVVLGTFELFTSRWMSSVANFWMIQNCQLITGINIAYCGKTLYCGCVINSRHKNSRFLWYETLWLYGDSMILLWKHYVTRFAHDSQTVKSCVYCQCSSCMKKACSVYGTQVRYLSFNSLSYMLHTADWGHWT